MEIEESVASVLRGVGWTRIDRLGLIQVKGPQRVKFLHGLLSNDIASLPVGGSRLAALMNLKGQQVAWMRVVAEEEALWCELPIEVRDTVVDTFMHYKVGAPVRFEKKDAAIYGILGPGAESLLADLGFSPPPLTGETFARTTGALGSLRTGRGLDLPASGFILHAEPGFSAPIEERLNALAGRPIDPKVLETLRVEEGIPWHGIDVREEHLLHETGQIAVYHSASKGCYLGQEVVARLEGRGGNVNKRFRGLKCAGSASAGDTITAEGKDVGSVTSAGKSPRFGPIAMGYLHRSQAEPGTTVDLPGGRAEVVELPFAS